MCWDPEVPAGYQEADMLQAQYEAESRQYVRDMKAGHCHHSATLGYAESAPGVPFYSAQDVEGMLAASPYGLWDAEARPVVWPPPSDGNVLCTECGRRVHDPFGEV